jgi:hypothetical protein
MRDSRRVRRGTAPRLSKKSTNKLTWDHLGTSCSNSNKRMEAGRSKVKARCLDGMPAKEQDVSARMSTPGRQACNA